MAGPAHGDRFWESMPLHAGHQLVIETGPAGTDEMAAIIYEVLPDVPGVGPGRCPEQGSWVSL